mgnify:CR=1 FL=1
MSVFERVRDIIVEQLGVESEWVTMEVSFCDDLEVDSLAYLTLDGMLSCMEFPATSYCTACFSGSYPIPVDHQLTKFALERHQMRMFE